MNRCPSCRAISGHLPYPGGCANDIHRTNYIEHRRATVARQAAGAHPSPFGRRLSYATCAYCGGPEETERCEVCACPETGAPTGSRTRIFDGIGDCPACRGGCEHRACRCKDRTEQHWTTRASLALAREADQVHDCLEGRR